MKSVTPILSIHCGIKPQNMLINEYWTAKLPDFGLAITVDARLNKNKRWIPLY